MIVSVLEYVIKIVLHNSVIICAMQYLIRLIGFEMRVKCSHAPSRYFGSVHCWHNDMMFLLMSDKMKPLKLSHLN